MPFHKEVNNVFSRDSSFDTWGASPDDLANTKPPVYQYTTKIRVVEGSPSDEKEHTESAMDSETTSTNSNGVPTRRPLPDEDPPAPLIQHTRSNSGTTSGDGSGTLVRLPVVVGHRTSWDSDGQFSAFEIERIKSKTRRLKSQREQGESIFRDVNDGFDEVLVQELSLSQKKPQKALTFDSSMSSSVPSGAGKSARKNKPTNWIRSRSLSKASSSVDQCSSTLEQADTTTHESSENQERKNRRQDVNHPTSEAVEKLQQEMMRDFESPRRRNKDLNVSDQTEQMDTSDETTERDFTLHDLCGEATTADDIAWRNALFSLALQPELARIQTDMDDGGWTPLHICCLGLAAPPTFIVRALLYAFSDACSITDEGGRLPLHLVAASSADITTLQLLVEEYPPAVHHADDHGLTPLHLLLRNTSVQVTADHIKILLGLFSDRSQGATTQQNNMKQVLQRRGEHLDIHVHELSHRMIKKRPVVTRFNRDTTHEAEFVKYPPDVQVSLRKLANWKHSQQRKASNNQKKYHEETVELELESVSNEYGETNPAAIPTSITNQLPIHMVLQRAMMDNQQQQQQQKQIPIQHEIDESEIPLGRTRKDSLDGKGSKLPDNKVPESFEEDVTKSCIPCRSKKDDSDEEDGNSVEAGVPSISNVATIIRILATVCPESLVFRDSRGLTPLLQVMQVDNMLPTLEVIEILLGKRSLGYERLPVWADDMPLHRILRENKSASTREFNLNPAMVEDLQTGQLPLHVAAEELLADYNLIETIYESYPGAIQVQDARGRTPLHLALNSYRRIPPDPRVIQLLFSDRVAQIIDDYGNIPFDLMLASAENLPQERPRAVIYEHGRADESSMVQENMVTVDASTIYQRFFHASLLGSPRSLNSTSSRDLLKRLRLLPPWLRAEACGTSFVQDLLVEELASPWKTAVIFLDGILLIILISVFRLQMNRFVDYLNTGGILSSWYTFAVYTTAALRLVYNAVFAALSVSTGDFRHLCLFNGWYWLDVWSMLFTIVTSILLYGNINDERLLALGTASTGFLWLSLIIYLKNWWYGMAIFVGGFTKLARRLLSPFLTAGIFIVAFAQMFYTLLQLDCEESIKVSSACSARNSYRVVYTLLRGGSLADIQNSQQLTAEAITMVAIFVLFLAVFLIAITVTILIGGMSLDFEEIAMASFWEPKLSFVLFSTELRVSKQKVLDERSPGLSSRLAQIWDLLVVSLTSDASKKREKWFSSSSGRLSWPLRVTAVFFLPIWMAVGLFTLGVLWPPQIRRFIFQPNSEKSRSTFAREQSKPQLSELRREIMQLRMMSVERSTAMEGELRQLKELLHIAMRED